MSSKFDHYPLNDCTSMVNNADNIMSSGYTKLAKAKSLPSAFLRKKTNNSTFTRENGKKNSKAVESLEHEKVLCNESVTSSETPKRENNRELESICGGEDMSMKHSSRKCQPNCEKLVKEKCSEKEQSSHEQYLNEQAVNGVKLFNADSNESHGNQENEASNCCNVVMHDSQSTADTGEQIYESKMRQVDDMQTANYDDTAAQYYNDNTNSIIDKNYAIDVNATNQFTDSPYYKQNGNERVKKLNKDILSPCGNKCQQQQHNEDESDTDHIFNKEAKTPTKVTITSAEDDTSDLLSSTPTPAHRNTFARYTCPLVQPLQRITETSCHDGCHNPYSPSLLLDECACMAESSFYSCYSDSAETQRETDSCSSPDRWHHHHGDSTPTTSQNITPTTRRAATSSTLPRYPLSEPSERCMNMGAHYLMRAPQSPQHVFPSLPHTTNYCTPTFTSRLSMTETQYDNEKGVYEHNDSLHNMDAKMSSSTKTDEPFEQEQGKEDKCTHKEVDKNEKFTKYLVEHEDAGANMLQQEVGCAKRYNPTEYHKELLEPRMSISAETDYSSVDLFTPYRNTHERPSWEQPLHEEKLSMTNNGVSRRLMWPSPLSPLSPSPSPTKASVSAITTHEVQLKDPFSSSQQRTSNTTLNNTSNSSINDTFTNINTTTTSNTSPTMTTASSSTSTTTMMMLKSMSRPSVTLHETVRSSHSHQPTTRVVKTIVQCGVDRSSGRPIPLRREDQEVF